MRVSAGCISPDLLLRAKALRIASTPRCQGAMPPLAHFQSADRDAPTAPGSNQRVSLPPRIMILLRWFRKSCFNR